MSRAVLDCAMKAFHPLISTAELAQSLGAPDLRVIDASWHLDGRDGRLDFEAARIPGAVFFDLEASSDTDNPLPHMLPLPEVFRRRMEALGVGSDDHLVVYDTVGIRSAPRAWWMLCVMGARRVQVLDGGLPKWLAEGLAIEHGPAAPPPPSVFLPDVQERLVADVDDVREALGTEAQLLDARAADRFSGCAAEPRPGLRSGHMPGALNLPFPGVIAPDGTMKDSISLKALFDAAGLDLGRPIITTCGSGVTASILSLALATLGKTSCVYDGSWAEWGGRDDLPIQTG